MHDILDDYAHSNGLAWVNPRAKLLLGLGSILLCVSAPSPLVPALVALTMSLTIVGPARIPLRFYSRLLLIPLSFALLSSVVVIFLHGSGEALLSFEVLGRQATVNSEGANLGLLLMSRTFGGMCALFFVALTTPMVEIFSILKSLHLPQVLIELSMLIYRYIFVLLEEAMMIHTAQELRLGSSSLRGSLHSFSMLTSVLFLRAWERGEKLMVAMDSRCYDGRLDILEREAPRSPRVTVVVVIYLAALGAVALLCKDLTLI
ncbi:MAG: cobalt ECF transporter T component CbiQ [Methanosarcinales archaeon]|nr:cobalt ECF transporter T component CbiQ [Methanosarcinales archaeon]